MSTNTETPAAAGPDPTAGLVSLLRRAEQGDLTALPELRRLLDADSSLWQRYGDLALQAEAGLVQLASGDNLLLAESLARKLAALKADLAGPSPSPLHKLLVERVAACWLQASYFDALAAQTRDQSPRQAADLQRRQDATHRRLLSAVKALETCRRHLRPAGPVSPPQPVPVIPEPIASRLGRRERRAAGAGGTN
jgi:hypothetical protein